MDVSMDSMVLSYGAAALTTLGFLATNSVTLRAQGELGLQQILFPMVVLLLLVRAGHFLLAGGDFDWGQFVWTVTLLVWHVVIL